MDYIKHYYRVGHLTFGTWISHKKIKLWIFFQKYGFIRKIEPLHLRMKQKIIEMTIFSKALINEKRYEYLFREIWTI